MGLSFIRKKNLKKPLPCSTKTIIASGSNSTPNFVQSDIGEEPFEKQLEDLNRELKKFDLPITSPTGKISNDEPSQSSLPNKENSSQLALNMFDDSLTPQNSTKSPQLPHLPKTANLPETLHLFNVPISENPKPSWKRLLKSNTMLSTDHLELPNKKPMVSHRVDDENLLAEASS